MAFMLPEGFDGCDHNRSTEETAVVPESLDEARSRLGVTLNCRDKCIAIGTQQNGPSSISRSRFRAQPLWFLWRGRATKVATWAGLSLNYDVCL